MSGDPPTPAGKFSSGFRWPVYLLSSVLVVLLLLAGSLAWLLNDSDRVKRLVEDGVTQLTNRPFSIEGDFDFSLGRITVIKATGIRWLNASWSNDKYMLELGEFSVTLDVLSLIQQPVVITNFAARDATVRLEWSDAGLSNWLLADTTDVADDEDKPLPLPLHLVAGSLNNVTLIFTDPGLAQPIQIDITEATHQEDSAHRLVIDGTSVIDGREQKLAGRIGPFPELAVAGAVDFDLTVTGPLALLAASGDFGELSSLSDPDLQLSLDASDAAELLRALQLPIATSGPVKFASRIATDELGIAASANGNFGEFVLQGNLTAKNLSSYDDFKLDLKSSGPSLRNAGGLAGYTDLPDAPYSLAVSAVRSDQGLELQQFNFDTAGLTINGTGVAHKLPELRDFELQFVASGDSLYSVTQLFDLPMESREAFAVRASIVGNGESGSDELRAELQLGSAQGSVTGSLSEAADFAGSAFQVVLNSPNVQPLATALGLVWREPQPMTFSASAVIDQDAVRITGIDATLADSVLAGAATLNRESSAVGFSGTLAGPDIAALVKPLLDEADAGIIPPLAYAAAADVEFAAGMLSIATDKLVVGESRFTLQGTVATNAPATTVDMKITVDGPNLGNALAHFKFDDIPATPFSAATRLLIANDAISLQDLRFSAAGAEVAGQLSFSGSNFKSIEFDLSASGDNLNTLVPDTQGYRPANVPFTVTAEGAFSQRGAEIRAFSAKLGKARFTLTGEILPGEEVAVRELTVNGSGPRLSDLGDFGGWQLKDVPFKVSAQLTGSAEDLRVNAMQLASGKNSVTGEFSYRAGSRPYVTAKLASTQLNINELRDLDPAAFTEQKSKSETAAFFSQEPLPFALLDEVDGEATVDFANLIFGERRIAQFNVELQLQEGVLNAPRISLSSEGGSLAATAALTPGPRGHMLALKIQADHLQLAFDNATGAALAALPKYAVDADLTATGESLHELAASANGYVWAIAGTGQMGKLMLGPLVGDFVTELLSAINPFVKKKTTVAIDCEGYYLEIDNGQVLTAPALVFQTGEVTIVASGKVNLESERIDFTFQTTPRKGIGVSVNDLVSPFTKVTGTLSAPKISLNVKDAAVEGSVAVATFGLSILAKSFFNRWIGTREVCQKVAGKAEDIRRDRDPQNVPDLEKFFAGIE